MLKIHMKLNTNFWSIKKSTGIKNFNNPKAFILYSNGLQNVSKKYWRIQSR